MEQCLACKLPSAYYARRSNLVDDASPEELADRLVQYAAEHPCKRCIKSRVLRERFENEFTEDEEISG